MKLPNISIAGAAVILVVIFFFVGRCTAPEKPVDNRELIDSLKRDREILLRLVSQHKEMEGLYRDKAEQNLKRAIEAEKIKVIHHTKYVQDTSRNHSYTVLQRDSVIRAEFLGQ
jgi:hypothetical protein